MKKIILATNNPNKVREIKDIIKNTDLEILAKSEIGQEAFDIEETGTRLEENALIKAQGLKDIIGPEYIVIADDTGLFVDALNGEPGVYTSSYGGVEHDDVRNNATLLKNLEGVTLADRTAKFKTVIAIVEDGREPEFVEGYVEGLIAEEEKGENGFGYDPLFIPKGHDKTFAELDGAYKNSLSHRKRAIENLAKRLKEIYG